MDTSKYEIRCEGYFFTTEVITGTPQIRLSEHSKPSELHEGTYFAINFGIYGKSYYIPFNQLQHPNWRIKALKWTLQKALEFAEWENKPAQYTRKKYENSSVWNEQIHSNTLTEWLHGVYVLEMVQSCFGSMEEAERVLEIIYSQ